MLFRSSPTLQAALLLTLVALAVTASAIATARLLHLRLRWLPRWMRLNRLSDLVLSADVDQKHIGRRFFVGVANCAAGVLALTRRSGWRPELRSARKYTAPFFAPGGVGRA